MKRNEAICCHAVMLDLGAKEKPVCNYKINSQDTVYRGDVEVDCAINGDRYLIEHTEAEPYTGSKHETEVFVQTAEIAVKQIRASGLLPSHGMYRLLIDANGMTNIKRAERVKVAAAIFEWLKTQLAQQEVSTSALATIPGVPFRVRLDAGMPHAPSLLLAARYTPDNLECLRVERITKALNKKKLKLAARQGNVLNSVLVFQNSDISLTNPSKFSDALAAAMVAANFTPDYVYLVDLFENHDCPEVTVWRVRQGEVGWHQLSAKGEHYASHNVQELLAALPAAGLLSMP